MEEKGGDWSQQKIEAAAIAQAEIADLQASEMEEWNRLFEFMEDGFNGALASMLLDGEFTFKALADSFLREFLKIGIAKTTAGIFGSLGGLFGSFGALSAGLAGGGAPDTGQIGPLRLDGSFANGGPVGGGPILVGERGPEVFLPGVSGFVANNQSLNKMGGGGGGGVSVTVINNTGKETSTTERDGPGGSREIEVMVGKAISKNISRGGDVDQAIRNSYGVNRVGRHGV
jgi:lambda family phage tail tape measure protein